MSGNKTSSTPNPNPQSGSTILSRASAHGRSQLKLQNLGVGGYTENVLKWFSYPRASAHPGCEVGSHGAESACIIGSSMLRRGQPDSGEGCIMLQSGPTLASLLSICSIQSLPAVRKFRAVREERCEPSHGQVCVNLMSWRPKCIRAM